MIYALRGNYELELMHLGRFLSPGMVVIDGGASCGIYTTVAAKLVGPDGLVLSFEPGAESFYALKRNVRLNRFENVRTYRAALSDKEGKATLYHHDGPNSFSLGHSDTTRTVSEEVVTCTLSRVVHEEACSPVGMIKLDVEGAEELVLRGAQSIIATSRPTILLEMNGAAAKRLGLSPWGAWQLLQGFGYRFFSMRQQGELCRLNHPPATYDIVNVVAIHSEPPK